MTQEQDQADNTAKQVTTNESSGSPEGTDNKPPPKTGTAGVLIGAKPQPKAE